MKKVCDRFGGTFPNAKRVSERNVKKGGGKWQLPETSPSRTLAKSRRYRAIEKKRSALREAFRKRKLL